MNHFEYEALTKMRVAQKLEGKINKCDKLHLAITAFGYKKRAGEGVTSVWILENQHN